MAIERAIQVTRQSNPRPPQFRSICPNQQRTGGSDDIHQELVPVADRDGLFQMVDRFINFVEMQQRVAQRDVRPSGAQRIAALFGAREDVFRNGDSVGVAGFRQRLRQNRVRPLTDDLQP